MIIDLQKIDEAAWCEFQDGVDLLIRPLSSSKRNELEKKATVSILKFEKGRRQQISELDPDKMESLIIAWIIKDWRGIVDPSKNKIPCTDENKSLVFDYLHDMRRFAIEAATSLHDTDEALRDADSKN